MNPFFAASPRPSRLIGLIVLGCTAIMTTPAARAQSEEAVKSALIYNFAKFTECSPATFGDASTRLVVGFVGGPVLSDAFASAINGKNVNGREIAVKKLAPGPEIGGCHVVVVADQAQVAAVLAAAKGKPVLTVGDTAGFVNAGGMLGFAKDGPRVVFELNLEPVAQAGLKLGEKLRGAARSVKGG